MPAKESKELSPEGLMQLLTQAAAIIHEEAVRIVQEGNIPPPLSPKTVKIKGSSKTLIDEGWLLGALTEGFKVTREGNRIRVEIGILDPEIARYAVFHEWGTAHTPRRPFLSTAYDRKIREALAYLSHNYVKIVENKLK